MCSLFRRSRQRETLPLDIAHDVTICYTPMSRKTPLGTYPGDPPKPTALIARIREIAKKSENVFFSDHASERLLERGLTDLDVIRGYRIGDIVGAISPGERDDEWVCEVVFPSSNELGRREVGVITIVVKASRLRIKTVMWKDRR